MAANLNPKILMLEKCLGLIPVVAVMPWFLEAPSLARLVSTCIVSVYYFFCFFGITYLLRYLADTLKLNGKTLNALVLASTAFMYAYSAYYLFRLLDGRDGDVHIESQLFIFPFVVLVRTMLLTFVLVCVLRLTRYGERKKEE
jgi:hypothetical protein